jgi:putative phage-type endonuclease
MPYIPKIEMSHEEWLQVRRQGIGSSDVPPILGLIPKARTPLMVYLDKIGESGPVPDNPAMYFGRKLEPIVADTFSEMHKIQVRNDHKVRIHPEHEYMMANLDRTILPGDRKGVGILECKTTAGYVANQWPEDDCPLPYFAQIQHQLFVTGYTWGYVAALVDGREFRDWYVEIDHDYLKVQNEILAEFWSRVKMRIPPEPILKDILLMRESPGKIVTADAEIASACSQLIRVKADLAAVEDTKKQLEARIKEVMVDGEILEYEGRVLATWKTSKASRVFNAEKFAAEHPELYEQYRETKDGSRRFVVKQ